MRLTVAGTLLFSAACAPEANNEITIIEILAVAIRILEKNIVMFVVSVSFPIPLAHLEPALLHRFYLFPNFLRRE